MKKPIIIRLIISETSSGNWHYHLRGVFNNEIYLGGKDNLRALCGTPVGWDTQIPLNIWGSKSEHIPQYWCPACKRIAEIMKIPIFTK